MELIIPPLALEEVLPQVEGAEGTGGEGVSKKKKKKKKGGGGGDPKFLHPPSNPTGKDHSCILAKLRESVESAIKWRYVI